MDVKILEKLIKDHLPDYADKFFHEDYKEENLQIVANQCTRLESELKAVREQKGKSAFFDRLEEVLNDLSFKSGHPEISYRSHENTRHAATALYLQRIAFLSDIEAYYEKESIDLFQDAERKADNRLQEWKTENSLLLNYGDREEFRELKGMAIRENQAWGGSLRFNGSNKKQIIKRLSFLLFGIDTGQDDNSRMIYVTKLSIAISAALRVEYLKGLIDGQNTHTKREPLPSFTELFFNKTNADKVRGVMPTEAKYWQSICFAMAVVAKDKNMIKPRYTEQQIARVLGLEFFKQEYPEKFTAYKYKKTSSYKDSKEVFDDSL